MGDVPVEQEASLALDPGVCLQHAANFFFHADAQLRRKPTPSENPEQNQALLETGGFERIEPRGSLDESGRPLAVDHRSLAPKGPPSPANTLHQLVKANPAQTELNRDGEHNRLDENEAVAMRETGELSQAIHAPKAYYSQVSARGIVSAFDGLLCTTLAEQSLPRMLSDDEFDELWARALAHSVDILLAAVLWRRVGLPDRVRYEAAGWLANAVLIERLRDAELRRILRRIGHIDLLLLKGVGLAHTIYPVPHLRRRIDVDLFVRPDAVAAVHQVLVACGYARRPAAALADSQRSYAHVDAGEFHDNIDLHWAVANPHPFAEVLPFDEAWRSSVAVAALGPTVRTLGHADALLLACVHRVAHHNDSPCLLWLWDIHLLATRLTTDEWEALVRVAQDTGMRAVTIRGLELAHKRFGSPIPAGIIDRLAPADRKEPAARFVRGLRQAEIALTDLAAMPSWRSRLTFVWENLFPPRAHMRTTYKSCPALLLPIAYLHRIVRGAPRWFRRPTTAEMDAPARHVKSRSEAGAVRS